jgi:uncharacterized protein YecE (DUF72 family)
MALLAGTSGWSYEDWAGVFYPQDLRKEKRLEYYAKFFHTVEINSTYYSFPSAAMVSGWVTKAARIDFEYSLKMPKQVTHDSLLADVPHALEFQDRVLAPMGNAGCLGATLIQLSPYFRLFDKGKKTDHSDRLSALLDSLDTARFRYAVEFRHSSWLSGGRLDGDVVDLLRGHDVAVCAVDGPSMPPIVEETAGHAYIRFHGHNADIWYGREKAGDGRMNRYDYNYGEQELAPWKARLSSLKAGTVRAYFNNHPHANAVKNAKLFESLMEVKSVPLPAGGQSDLSKFF